MIVFSIAGNATIARNSDAARRLQQSECEVLTLERSAAAQEKMTRATQRVAKEMKKARRLERNSYSGVGVRLAIGTP